MPDIANPQQQMEKPSTAGAPATEPAMFVMPAEYRHGATGKKMAVPAPAARPVTAPPVVVAPKPGIPGAPKKGMSTKKKIALGAGGIVVVALVVTGIVVATKPEPAPVVVPVVVKPTPAPAPKPVPKPVETPKPVEVPKPVESPFPAAVIPGTDTDSDGLTDIEEKLIYGTNARLPDSDSDGFLDGNEVYHRYNPAGTSPGTLYAAGLVKVHQGTGYSLFYPAIWKVEPAAADGLVTIVATSGETVTIALAKLGMPEGTTPDAWYKKQEIDGSVTKTTTKNGSAMLVSEDQMTNYVFTRDYVMTIKMTTAAKATVDYLQTFKMMLNSVTWL